MSDNVVPFRKGLSRAAAERLIRAIAADTSSLVFPWRVAKQMTEAGITIRQVIATLRLGAVVENPMRNEKGDWICVLRRRSGGLQVLVEIKPAEDRSLTLVGIR